MSTGSQHAAYAPNILCDLLLYLIVCVQSRSRVESNAKFVQSKLNFVDLAGSERLSKTQVRSALIGQSICQSISQSEKCITYAEKLTNGSTGQLSLRHVTNN